MSTSLHALKTVTLSHESVLTAMCALGRQRMQDKELLQRSAESGRAWVQREIAMTDAAILGLQSAVYAVRYCHECGHVGDVLPPALNCCPDSHSSAMVHPDIARQARIGLLSRSKSRDADQCGQRITWSSNDAFENSIISLAPTIFALQFVSESCLEQLIDGIHEIAQTSHANAAVNFTFIIAYADLHALHLDNFFDLDIQRKLIGDLPIEIRYLLASEDGTLHFFHGPSHLLSYVGKYLTKKCLA